MAGLLEGLIVNVNDSYQNGQNNIGMAVEMKMVAWGRKDSKGGCATR